MTPGELSEVLSQIEGNLIGLGVELWAEKDDLRIVEVFDGSPASAAGLRTGIEFSKSVMFSPLRCLPSELLICCEAQKIQM